jgi:hypothetical protein
MSKQLKIEQIKEVVIGRHKPRPCMKIFIQRSPVDESKYYTEIPCANNVEITCPDEACAKTLEEFLTTDID